MPLSQNDVTVLRDLARRYAEYAALPEQAERRARWVRHNMLRDERPLVLIDQLPWNELNDDGSLTNQVTDPYWRGVETWLRQEIYKWRVMPVDMVLDPYIKLRRPIHSSGWGIDAHVTRLAMDKTSDVYAQQFEDLINEPEDIEKIHNPELTLDAAAEKEIEQTADWLFDGIIPWRFVGLTMHLGVWDTITMWMGVENCYIELMDRPEMMHALMERLTQGLLYQIETANRLGLYDGAEHYCHCSHTYRDDDDQSLYGTTQGGWAFGLAQLFTSVSPKITDEFECAYMKRVFPHFRHIYYGCCDRLDDRMEYIITLPNVRKISCSPWSEREAFAEKIPRSMIMSNKPSPALMATDTFDEDAVRADLRRTIDAARRNGKKLEMILKDISTVRYQPDRLRQFSRIALEETQR